MKGEIPVKVPWAALLVASLLLAAPPPAGAEGRAASLGSPRHAAARLEWTLGPGADACIDGERLSRAVNARWGRRVFTTAPDARLTLRGRAERQGDRWAIGLELVGSDGLSRGARDLATTAPHCSALDDSVALAAGLMLDVPVEGQAQEAPPRPAAPAVIRIPRDTAAPREPWVLELTAGGRVDLGLLPGIAAGGSVGLGAEVPRGPRLGAAFVAWLPAETQGEGAGVEMSAWAIELSACTAPRRGGSAWPHACLVQRLGRAEGRGFDVSGARQAAEPFASAGAAGGVTVSAGEPVLIRAATRVDVALLRYRFGYDDSAGARRTVHAMSALSGGLELDVGVRF